MQKDEILKSPYDAFDQNTNHKNKNQSLYHLISACQKYKSYCISELRQNRTSKCTTIVVSLQKRQRNERTEMQSTHTFSDFLTTTYSSARA